MCFVEVDDWVECKSRKKHRAFQNFLGSELEKVKIYSLPTYDPHTDTFKDGALPNGIDGYFSKNKSERNYYSWNRKR